MSYDQLTADVIKENAELKAKILAQEEELDSLVNTLLERDREILAIQADNQELKAELLRLEA